MLSWFLAEPAHGTKISESPLTWEQAFAQVHSVGLAGIMVALVWALAAGLLAWQLRGQWRNIWPVQRFYAVPWGAFQIALLMVLGWVLSDLWLESIHWSRKWSLVRFVLASTTQVVIFLWVPLRFMGILPYQLGWNCSRWREDVILAGLMWVPAAAITLGVWMISLVVWPATQHDLVQELTEAPSWPNYVAFVLVAVVLAPLAEETLFRGLILRKMAAEPLLADVTMLLALLIAIVKGYGARTWGPLLFPISAGAGYLVFEWLTSRLLPRPGSARAVYASSLIFAALHAEAWPTPVPLFFLALFLGTLAARTQSLVAPVTLHLAFNSTTVIALLLEQTVMHRPSL